MRFHVALRSSGVLIRSDRGQDGGGLCELGDTGVVGTRSVGLGVGLVHRWSAGQGKGGQMSMKTVVS